MNNRQRHWIPVLLLTALLASCAGGTSGSVLGSRESCRINAGSGICDGTFNSLKGTYGKDDDLGRWPLEYTYNGKTWVDIEEKGKPSKWVTLRALRVIRARAEGANGS